ncbi:MAG: hypothetical protein ACRDQ2_08950 [Gaiellales bacterium]
MGLGFVLWLLVEGIAGRAATALDAILGIAWGIAVETANDLPAEDQTGAGRLIDELISGDTNPRGLILSGSRPSQRVRGPWPDLGPSDAEQE